MALIITRIIIEKEQISEINTENLEGLIYQQDTVYKLSIDMYSSYTLE
jgi:hypothetical protein